MIKLYKCYISLGLLVLAITAHFLTKTPIYHSNTYVNIIFGLIGKNEFKLIMLALLFLALFFVENTIAQKVSGNEEGGEEDG